MAKPKQRIQVIGDDLLSFNLFRERKLDVIYWQSGKPSKNEAGLRCYSHFERRNAAILAATMTHKRWVSSRSDSSCTGIPRLIERPDETAGIFENAVLTRMALSLGIGLSGVAFPIPIAMDDFVELMARLIEQRKGLRSTFNSARFPAAKAIRHLIASDGLQQLGDELTLLFL